LRASANTGKCTRETAYFSTFSSTRVFTAWFFFCVTSYATRIMFAMGLGRLFAKFRAVILFYEVAFYRFVPPTKPCFL